MLRRANRALRLFSLCNTAVVHAIDENALLRELCRIAVDEAGYRLAWVGRAEHDPTRSVRLVTYAGPGEFLGDLRISWAEGSPCCGAAGRTIRSGKSSIVEDLTTDPTYDALQSVILANGLGSAMGVPIRVGAEVYGALVILAAEPHAFDAAESGLLEQLGNNISHGMTSLRAQRERSLAERAALRLLDRLRRAQAVGEVGSWELDLPSQTMWGSEEAFRIYGLPRPPDQTLSLATVQQVPRPEDRELLARSLAELLARGRPYDVEFAIQRAGDGERRSIHSRAELVRDGAGRPVTVVGTIQDITDRRRLEEQLLQAQKMESVGRLAGGIAHDFNNLLTVIHSYAEMLLVKMGAGNPHAQDLEEIRTAARRAADLTRQLLAFSRRQVLRPQVVSMNEILSGAERMLRRVIGEDVDLTVTLPEDVGNVFADRGQIEQVVMNLAVNARDAMAHGGTLTMETANVELSAAQVSGHLDVKPGRYVTLAICDTGAGMDETTRVRIFEPFFTTKGERGTGLGLSTVYGIVRQSGGDIWVHSEPDRGTTFKVYLPRSEDAPRVVAAPRAEPRPSCPGGTTVLVVEDDEQVRGLVCGVLSRAGYEVLGPTSPTEALKLTEHHHGPIDLLLTAIVMPRVTGPELAKRPAASHPGAKVLYMSGYTDEAIARDGLLDSSVAFLPKPLSPESLLSRVREVLDGR
jgi:PAS domain S-box-containing protein